jgi:hypothetical protein
MPITCRILHLERLVVGVSDGVITLKDIADFIDKVLKERAGPYRKIFDARRGTSGLSAADLKILSKRLNPHPNPKGLGPFAIVATNDRSELAAVLRPFATIDRPMRIFKDMPGARRWIDHQKTVGE